MSAGCYGEQPIVPNWIVMAVYEKLLRSVESIGHYYEVKLVFDFLIQT